MALTRPSSATAVAQITIGTSSRAQVFPSPMMKNAAPQQSMKIKPQ